MKELATLLNELRETGVALDYALFGAVAQMRYTEPVATLDVKDHARVLAFLESRAVRADEVESLARLHGLEEKWARFRARFVDA